MAERHAFQVTARAVWISFDHHWLLRGFLWPDTQIYTAGCRRFICRKETVCLSSSCGISAGVSVVHDALLCFAKEMGTRGTDRWPLANQCRTLGCLNPRIGIPDQRLQSLESIKSLAFGDKIPKDPYIQKGALFTLYSSRNIHDCPHYVHFCCYTIIRVHLTVQARFGPATWK